MFTGIIQEQAKIIDIKKNPNTFSFETNLDLGDCNVGSSINCNGICLTIISINFKNLKYIFKTNIGEETIKRTNAKYWKKNQKINIEKSLKIGEEISGHFVYGHVDYTSKLIKINSLKSSWDMFFSYPPLNKKKYITEKGSISIDGISLTVSNKLKNNFAISIIDHTYNMTNLSNLKINDAVNIEFDMLSRYIFNR